MCHITLRDIAGLTPSELMQAQRIIGEDSQWVQHQAERHTNRLIRAGIDHDENNGEQQISPDEE